MRTTHTYARIDLDAIADNFDAIREKAGKRVMAVIKANAYGHGAVPVARLLQDKCSFFGLANIAEALQLRQAGIDKPILLLGHTPVETFSHAIREDIRVTIFRWEDALQLSKEALRQGKTGSFHFAVDTGMSRIGFQVTEEDADLCARIAALPGLYAEGLFSHFATADCADLTRARAQAERFARFCDMLAERGVHIPIRHLDNSAGIMNFGCEYDMVRAGIILYGMYPSDEVDPSLLSIRPALRWVSRVINLQLLPPGREIGYGGTFVTERPTMVATIPVGYADGYRRNLSNKFYVLIRGKKAPILGRVCMDQMMVDVTDIPHVAHGDEVILIGASGEDAISIEEISAAADSFPYEFACGIGYRVPRVYYRGDSEQFSISYLLDH